MLNIFTYIRPTLHDLFSMANKIPHKLYCMGNTFDRIPYYYIRYVQRIRLMPNHDVKAQSPCPLPSIAIATEHLAVLHHSSATVAPRGDVVAFHLSYLEVLTTKRTNA